MKIKTPFIIKSFYFSFFCYVFAGCLNESSTLNSYFYQTADGDIFFPQQSSEPKIFMEALHSGRLVVDEGLLLIKSSDGVISPPIWRHGYKLKIKGDVIEVLDEEDQVRVHVGQNIISGGGWVKLKYVDHLDDNVKRELQDRWSGTGPYWVMGEGLKPVESGN